MVSDGSRVTCGTSARSSFQAASDRHVSGGTHANPLSIEISLMPKRSNAPSITRLATLACATSATS